MASTPRTIAGRAVVAGLSLAIPIGICSAVTAQAATVAAAPADNAGTRQAVGRVHPGDMGHQPPAGQCSESAVTAILMPFSEHLNHAHFQRSPEQQASDIEAFATYTNTHVALVQAMANGGSTALGTVPTDTLTPFIEHMKYAHIERPPQQQVSDAQQTDDYVKLHTVLVEHMTQPGRTAVIGDC